MRNRGVVVGIIASCLLAGTLTLPALAQEARVSREREALRRAQAALIEAQQREQALQADKAALVRDKARLEADARSATEQTAALQAQLQRASRQLGGLRGDFDAQRQRDAATLGAASAAARSRDEAARQQVAGLQRDVAERTQAVAGVSRLLERAIQALAETEAQNRKLHAIGMQAVQRWQAKTCTESQLQADPFLGLTAVRLENEAEALRAQLDEQRARVR